MKTTITICDHCGQEENQYLTGLDASVTLAELDHTIRFDIRSLVRSNKMNDPELREAHVCKECTHYLLRQLVRIELGEATK